MKVTQSCLTLWDAMDSSLLGSSVHAILQARVLEWVAIPFSRGSSTTEIEPRSPALQAHSLPAELSGKPKQLRLDAKSTLTDSLAAFSVFHFTFYLVNLVKALFIDLRYLFSFVCFSLLPGVLS